MSTEVVVDEDNDDDEEDDVGNDDHWMNEWMNEWTNLTQTEKVVAALKGTNDFAVVAIAEIVDPCSRLQSSHFRTKFPSP